jgi:antitoxin PrlF
MQTQNLAVTSFSTLTSKGQTTIPQEIRESLGMQSGDKICYTQMPDGSIVMRLKSGSLLDLAGSMKAKKLSVPLKQLSR